MRELTEHKINPANDTLKIEVTDEAGAIEALGLKPKLVQGSITNFKVTYPEDLQLAETILANCGRQS